MRCGRRCAITPSRSAPWIRPRTICGARKPAQPVYRLWGLNLDKLPVSNYTIGIDTIEKMVAKLQEFPGWPIYKIKLGTAHDLEIVRQLRQHTDAVFRVDANCGWTADETLRNATRLRDLNVEFIEQPLPADAGDQMRRVWAESALPVIADESCVVPEDVRALSRLLSRREHQVGQMRRPDAGPADDRSGPTTGSEGDGRLHDGIHRRASPPSPSCCRCWITWTWTGPCCLAQDIASGATVERGVCHYPQENGAGVHLTAKPLRTLA